MDTRNEERGQLSTWWTGKVLRNFLRRKCTYIRTTALLWKARTWRAGGGRGWRPSKVEVSTDVAAMREVEGSRNCSVLHGSMHSTAVHGLTSVKYISTSRRRTATGGRGMQLCPVTCYTCWSYTKRSTLLPGFYFSKSGVRPF